MAAGRVCVWGVRVVAPVCMCMGGAGRGGRCVCVWGVRVVAAGLYVYGG